MALADLTQVTDLRRELQLCRLALRLAVEEQDRMERHIAELAAALGAMEGERDALQRQLQGRAPTGGQQ